MSAPARHLVATHWGTYLAADGTAAGEALRPLPEDERPSPIGFDLPASRLAPARVLKPAVRESYLRLGAQGRPRQARRRALRRGLLGHGAGHRRRRAGARAQRLGQRGDLRRLLRLGQRRALPPRAEPRPPLPQLHRRLHPLGRQLQLRRRRRAAAARHRRHALARGRPDELEVAAPGPVAGADVRRHAGEERPGRLRRHRPSPPARRARRLSRGGLPLRLGLAGARRRARRERRALDPDPPQHRRRADARPGARARRRERSAIASSSPAARSASRSSRPTCWAAPTASRRPPEWAARITEVPAGEIRQLARAARLEQCLRHAHLVAAARRARRAAVLDGDRPGGDARRDRPAGAAASASATARWAASASPPPGVPWPPCRRARTGSRR